MEKAIPELGPADSEKLRTSPCQATCAGTAPDPVTGWWFAGIEETGRHTNEHTKGQVNSKPFAAAHPSLRNTLSK